MIFILIHNFDYNDLFMFYLITSLKILTSDLPLMFFLVTWLILTMIIFSILN